MTFKCWRKQPKCTQTPREHATSRNYNHGIINIYNHEIIYTGPNTKTLYHRFTIQMFLDFLLILAPVHTWYAIWACISGQIVYQALVLLQWTSMPKCVIDIYEGVEHSTLLLSFEILFFPLLRFCIYLSENKPGHARLITKPIPDWLTLHSTWHSAFSSSLLP